MSEHGSGAKNASTASKRSKPPLPADMATIRAACFDALDANTRELYAHDCEKHRVTDEDANEARMALVDAIITRITQLQQPPFVEQGPLPELTVGDCLRELREMFGDGPYISVARRESITNWSVNEEAQRSVIIQIGNWYSSPEPTCAAAMSLVRRTWADHKMIQSSSIPGER